MNKKGKVLTSSAAAGVLMTAVVPYHVLADQPPLHQYGGEDELQVSQIGQYDSGVGEGGTEIMAYDEDRELAFVTNGAANGFDILSFEELELGEFTEIDSQNRVLLSDFGIENVDDITSIASHPTEDLIAISAVSDPKTDAGNIVFATKSGEYVTHVQVGAMPDMVTFTPDGEKAITANEGEPSDDYSVDPEGSVSIIDVDSFTVNTLDFSEAELDGQVRADSPGTTIQQLEPEFVTIADDSQTAYVTLQENNAIATVDLVNEQIVAVNGLGVKDHSQEENAMDAAADGEIDISKQPLFGFYMPDAIDTFTADGHTYIVTPNEGDARDYGAYSEEAAIGDIAEQLDLNAEHYAGYTQAELDAFVNDGGLEELAETDITIEQGENEDGQYEALFSYGGRGFSIFDADTMELVYDSGSEFEEIIADASPENFNVSNDEVVMDDRSTAKGPEPETAVTGEIDGTTYAFIALERFSGIMIYDLSNLQNPEFVSLVSSRDFSEDAAGDVSPEGLEFISAQDSPTGNPLLAATHEISGTIAVYEFNGGEVPAEPSAPVEEDPFTPEAVDFEDLDDHWAEETIESLAAEGIIAGVSDSEFAPHAEITRASFTAMLTRALDLDVEQMPENISFNDVNKADWFAPEVLAASKAGIISGYGDETFRPNEPITREQMAALLTRALETVENTERTADTEAVLKPYNDSDQVSAWAEENVAVAVDIGLIVGISDSALLPQTNADRAEAAVMIQRFINEMNN